MASTTDGNGEDNGGVSDEPANDQGPIDGWRTTKQQATTLKTRAVGGVDALSEIRLYQQYGSGIFSVNS